MFNKSKVLLLCILLLGLFLRIYGNNWDQGWHLHPDERFLTMVGVNLKIPASISVYLDQYKSQFNPVNSGNSFFVYGTFPILINKVLAQYFYTDSYDLFNLQGRVLSGIADFLVIFIIFKLLMLVEKRYKFSPSIKYVAASFYAIAVLPIQLSHFFTVDTLLNFFCWLSFYFAVKAVVKRNEGLLVNVSLSGLFYGLAVACKVSAVLFAPLVGLFIVFAIIGKGWRVFLIGLTSFIFISYLALRLGSPYYFETGTIINPQPSALFLKNIETLRAFDNPAVLFPPSNQWIHASPFMSITNLIFFGVGPFFALLASIGFFLLWRQKRGKLIYIALVWVVIFTIYQSSQIAKSMRYLFFIYPFLAIFAAVGTVFIFQKLKKIPNKFLHYSIYSFIIVSVVVWPLAFMSIYTRDHSRVTASKWIFNNIPQNSTFTYEYWDDPLPLMVQDPSSRNYQILEIHIFDPDTKEKWKVIDDQLKQADYYIMSSNRGWGSIPTTPERYPIAAKFYEKMFKGKGDFRLSKEFSSYPSLRYLGIPLDFPDQWAEEAFTVYDHPLVTIFKKK